MKTMFKVFWPVIALLALNACQKEKELVSPVQPTPVPVPSYDKNTLIITADNTSGFYANYALTGSLRWTYKNPGMTAFTPAAVSSNYTIFADAATSSVYCMDTWSGDILWEKGEIYTSNFISPLLVNDFLYITNETKLQVYNPQNGGLVNEFPIIPYPHSLNYVNGLLIYNNCGGHLVAMNTDGVQQWEYMSPAGCYHTNPAIADNTIYILSSSGYLGAVNVMTGTELWSKYVGGYTYDASLVYDDGMLFAIDHKQSDKIYAFSAANGELVHTYRLPDGESCNMFLTPAVKNGKMYFLTEEGTLLAYSVEDELVLWQKKFDVSGCRMSVQVKNGNRIERTESHSDMTSVIMANNWLYFGAGKFIYAVDINSTTYWQAPLNSFVYNSPVVLTAYGNVYRAGTAGVVIK
jgi:outer membrane protein assembly factor BamB